MAILVSHAMHRSFSSYSPSDDTTAFYSQCNNNYLMNETNGNNYVKNLLLFNNGNQGILSHSMDPWIYGSTDRTANQTVLCQCLNPKISKRTKNGSNICKKCKATVSRVSSDITMDYNGKFETVRCNSATSQIPKTIQKAKTLRGLSSVASKPTNRQSIIPSGSIDPYDLMRRSRLTVPEINSTISPFRSNENNHKIIQNVESRSIIECNINPYELMMENHSDNSKLVELKQQQQQQQEEYENIDISNAVTYLMDTSLNNYKSILKKPNNYFTTNNNSAIEDYQINNINVMSSSQTLSKPKIASRVCIPMTSSLNTVYSPLSLKKKVQFIDSDFQTDTEQNYGPANKNALIKLTDTKNIKEIKDKQLTQHTGYQNTIFQWNNNDCMTNDSEKPMKHNNDKMNSSSNNPTILRSPNNENYEQMPFINNNNNSNSCVKFNNGNELASKEVKLKTRTMRPSCPPPPPPTSFQFIAKVEEGQTACIEMESKVNQNISLPLENASSNELPSNPVKNETLAFEDVLTFNKENLSTIPSVPPRKRSKDKQRQRSFSNNDLIDTDTTKSSVLNDTNKTIVHVSNNVNSSTTVYDDVTHKIQIKNDFPSAFQPSVTFIPVYETNENPQRKTSIIINGDDCCYSTVNVNNDNVPLYQSSVVITDGSNNNSVASSIVQVEQTSNQNKKNNDSSIYIKTDSCESGLKSIETTKSCTSFGVVLDNELTTYENINRKSFFINYYDGVTVKKENIMKKEEALKTTEQLQMLCSENRIKSNFTTIPVQLSSVCDHPSTTTTISQMNNLLRNPVEAVRHDLVPHVCGKSDMIRRHQSISMTKSAVFIHHDNDDQASKPVSSPLSINKILDNNEVDDGDHDNSTKLYTAMNDEISEYYTDPCNSIKSSLIDDDDDDDDLSYQTKFYELLANDENVVEVVENNSNNNNNNIYEHQHYYESIKANGRNESNIDPIYEDIEIPPPLPSNPPPADISDLYLDKEYTTRSIFEGASKYDILSYLVDAKERGITTSCQEDDEIDDYYHSCYCNNNNMINHVERDHANSKSPITSYNQHRLSTISDLSEDNNSSLLISSSLDGSINEDDSFDKYGTATDVERKDSGVGSETSSKSSLLSKYRSIESTSALSCCEVVVACEDCDSFSVTIPYKPVTPTQKINAVDQDPLSSSLLLCKKCCKKRSERKEIIMEIVETEEKYNKDLQIILEEFYQPMLVAGLLTLDQLSAIFLNVEELLENSHLFVERLRDSIDLALNQNDDDLLSVNIGKLFLDGVDQMLHTFEMYCVRQGQASLLLANLEKEKELLRIFLHVSQMENVRLRRMNLNAFLMVPIQRVTKYPLLIARLIKVTPSYNLNPHFKLIREQLKEAQHKIELHLNHINSHTKDVSNKLWKKIGNTNSNNNSLLLIGRRSSNNELDLTNIKLRKIAVDVLEWNHDKAKFILEGKLLFTQPTDNYWKKGRTIKLTPINALLIINGKTSNDSESKKLTPNRLINTSNNNNTTDAAENDNSLIFSSKCHSEKILEAALLLVRDKNGRYSLLREPLYLDRCIIAADPAWKNYFEVQEVFGKDTFIFKAEVEEQTRTWHKKLQFYSQGMGTWRRRRNALANIMINGMGLR